MRSFLASLLLSFFIIGWSAKTTKNKSKNFKTCPVKTLCGKNESLSEIEKWECLGKHLFRYTSDPLNEKYAEHDCGGVGWGNSIRGLYNAVSIASVLDRRLIIRFDAFNRLWMPPNGLKSWNYGVDDGLMKAGLSYWDIKETWDFEKYGRSPNRFQNWVKNLTRSSSVRQEYNKMVMQAGICGAEREIFTTGNCLTKALPLFGSCALSTQRNYMPDQMLMVPFFHTVFSRPSSDLVKHLKTIRKRLDLPLLEPGLEPAPGAWGLYTPGYYMLALHFRRVPVGFEPLSVELNEGSSRQWRLDTLEGYWVEVSKFAKKARQLAKCRGEKLLIYFATDDVANLRPEAKKRLSQYGEVVFGLREDEVGHVSPQWTASSVKQVKDLAKKLGMSRAKDQKKLLAATSAAEGASGEASGALAEGAASAPGSAVSTLSPSAGQFIADVDKSQEATVKHGTMALVEWWILGNAQWLVSHSGTSYSDSSAGWGLGPKGFMERMDIIHGRGSVFTAFRRDWEGDSCTEVGAADKKHAKTCPNSRSEAHDEL